MMNRRHFIVSTASLMAVMVLGCAEDEDRHRSRRRGRSEDDWGRDHDGRGFDEVPRNAKRINPDRDGRLRYEAGRDGRVYLVDDDDGVVIFSADLRDGEKIVADPVDDRLTIDGKRVGKVSLRSRHRYRLYFDRRE